MPVRHASGRKLAGWLAARAAGRCVDVRASSMHRRVHWQRIGSDCVGSLSNRTSKCRPRKKRLFFSCFPIYFTWEQFFRRRRSLPLCLSFSLLDRKNNGTGRDLTIQILRVARPDKAKRWTPRLHGEEWPIAAREIQFELLERDISVLMCQGDEIGRGIFGFHGSHIFCRVPEKVIIQMLSRAFEIFPLCED